MNARLSISALLGTLIPAVALLASDPAPRIGFGTPGDAKVVELPGAHDANCWTIEASIDLAHWVELGEIFEIDGTGDFSDSSAHLFKKRYYRAFHHGNDIQAALDRNRGRWERSGITNYDFTFQWLCFCAPDYVAPVNIFVRDAAVAAVSRVADGRELDSSEFERYRTVDGLFDLLQEAINQETHRISARFAPGTGAPRRAWIDYNRGIADEELAFVVEDLRVARATPVQITDVPPADLQLDPFTLEVVRIDGDTLNLTVQHGGGCRPHNYELFMSPGTLMESFPVQADLYLRHDSNEDMCHALIRSEISFNLKPISDLYGQHGTIVLNIYEYFTGDPVNRVRVNYEQ